jgi:hypothetical protein
MMVHRGWDSSGDAPVLLFLDFDWAGPDGEVKYPLNVDGINIKRHDEAYGGAVIRKEHDLVMAEHLFD